MGTYLLIAVVALYYVLLVRSHVRPYLLLRVKGEHMKYLLTAALPITGVCRCASFSGVSAGFT